jgi:hypothetical protein
MYQIGDGTSVDKSIPTEILMSGVLSGKKITQISNSEYFTCCIANDLAYCWGSNK